MTDLSELYHTADVGAIMILLSRIAVDRSLTTKLDDVRNYVQERCISALREYRSLTAQVWDDIISTRILILG